LIKHFKSIKRIKEATFEELSSVLGQAKAQKIQEYFTHKTT
ncbi:MAG: hypothetical protein HUJ97_08525, partial [Bacteroidales bacterium]|nr:hypothetical protein [Bacteroidales bacterium]